MIRNLLVAAWVLAVASTATPVQASDNLSLPDETNRKVFLNMLAGGWSFNNLKTKNPDGTTTIVHRTKGAVTSARQHFALCALSTTARLADPGDRPDIVVWYQGSGEDHKAKVWVGGCVHADGPADRSMVAKPRREGLVLMFKRVK